MLPAAAVLFFSASASSPAIPIAPLRAEHGTWVLELRADGTLVNRAGAPMGRVDGDEIDIGDTPVVRVDEGGGARSAYFRGVKRFDDEGALVLTFDDEERRLVVDDGDELVIVRPSGERIRSGIRVTGATTPSTRRTAVLLGTVLHGLETDGPPEQPPRVALTLDLFNAVAGYFDIVSELRLDRHFSLALHSGLGLRATTEAKHTTWREGWELGVEPRWKVPIRFPHMYLAWSTRYAHARTPIGFETWAAPPGLSSGPLVGFKIVMLGVTADVSQGVLFPLITPGSEPSHPPAAFVVRFGLGYSF